MKHLDSNVEELEQYSRRNCLLIHGIPHVKGEYTYCIRCVKFSEKEVGY